MPEKTCPPHEWRVLEKAIGSTVAICKDPKCKERLTHQEVERRLNACEVLSAEDAQPKNICASFSSRRAGNYLDKANRA